MLTKVFIILFAFNLHAQVDSTARLLIGNKSVIYYSYVPLNSSATLSADAIFTGTRTKTRAIRTTGGQNTPTYYMRAGLGYSLTDSTSGYTHTIDPITDDTNYVYSQSVFYIEGDGDTIWLAAAIDTVASILMSPVSLNVITSGSYSLLLGWTANTSKTWGSTMIERKLTSTPVDSFAVIDTISIDSLDYEDTDLVSNVSYTYRVRHKANNFSTYSDTASGTVKRPDYQFVFVPSTINFGVVDSVQGAGAETTMELDLINSSGGAIKLDSLTNYALPFSVTSDSTLPETVADGDTLGLTVTLDRDTLGIFSQTLYVNRDTTGVQEVIFYAEVQAGVEPEDWDYISDWSDSLDLWTSYDGISVATSNIDGIADDIAVSKDDVMRIVSSSGDTYYGIKEHFMGSQVGKRFEVRYTYLIPNSGNIPSINFAGFDVGGEYVLHSGSRSSATTGLWTTVDFDVTMNDSYDKVLACGWDADTTPDSFYIADVRWRVVVEDVSDTTAPVSPTTFTATGYKVAGTPKTYVDLSHNATVSGDADYYTYYRGDTEGEIPALDWDSIGTNNVGTHTFQDTIPAASDEYDYYITCTDDSGNVSWTTNPSDSALVPAGVVVAPPDTPVLEGVGGLFKVDLTWGDVSDETNYVIRKDAVRIDTVAANTVAYLDSPLVHNTEFTYDILAYNAGGEGNWSNAVIVSTTDTTTPPSGNYVYVDNAASGSNNGSSWANAYESFAAIDWGSISADDIIYISGGTVSKTYNESLVIPLGQDDVTITKGVNSGHNGEVILDGQFSISRGIFVNGRGSVSSGIEISNLTIKKYTSYGIYGDGENSGGIQDFTVDNCTLLNFRRAGIFIEGNGNVAGNTNIEVKNSYFDDDDSYGGQSDGIYIQYLDDFTADNNYIILDNNTTSPSDLHSDNIQSWWVNDVTYLNNTLVQSSDKTLGTQMLFVSSGNGTHTFYNNVFYRNCPNAIDWAIRLKNSAGGNFTGVVYSNSFIGHGKIMGCDATAIIRNNAFYSLDDSQLYTTGGGSTVSNNEMGDTNPGFTNTNYATFNMYPTVGSDIVDTGYTLGSPYNVDIAGTARPQNSVYDIGAYEYVP